MYIMSESSNDFAVTNFLWEGIRGHVVKVHPVCFPMMLIMPILSCIVFEL